MNIIKIRDSPFSLFTCYQSQRGKPNFFFGDRVSFRSLYSPSGILCRRRQIFSPPVTFSGQLFSGWRPQIPRRTRPIYTLEETLLENSHPRANMRRSSPAARVPRADACGGVTHFPVPRLHLQLVRRRLADPSLRRSSPSLPSPPFWQFRLSRTSVSRSSPLFRSLFFISSSTGMIRPPIRALFNPKVIQSPVKWIWRLKSYFYICYLWISYYHIRRIDW